MTAPDAYTLSLKPPKHHEPPAATVDSFIDRETGHPLLQGYAGGLLGLPPDPTQERARPPVVTAAAELVAESAGWLESLRQRQLQLMEPTLSADDLTVAVVRMADEIAVSGTKLAGALEAKGDALALLARDIASTLAEPDPALDAEFGKSLMDFWTRLDERGRADFLARAERENDHLAMAVVAHSKMTRYLAPKLNVDDLKLKAGAARMPNLARMAGAYSALAQRMQSNARKLAQASQEIAATVTGRVDPDRLRLARRSRVA